MLLSKGQKCLFLINGQLITQSKGCHVWNLDNKKLLDMSLMSVGTNILGYSNNLVNKVVIKSIVQQYQIVTRKFS